MRNENVKLLWPVFMLALSLVLFLGFHVRRAWREGDDLAQVSAALRGTTQEAEVLRQRLDRLAGGVLRLAESGNANAKLLIERLRQAGASMTQPADMPVNTVTPNGGAR